MQHRQNQYWYHDPQWAQQTGLLCHEMITRALFSAGTEWIKPFTSVKSTDFNRHTYSVAANGSYGVHTWQYKIPAMHNINKHISTNLYGDKLPLASVSFLSLTLSLSPPLLCLCSHSFPSSSEAALIYHPINGEKWVEGSGLFLRWMGLGGSVPSVCVCVCVLVCIVFFNVFKTFLPSLSVCVCMANFLLWRCSSKVYHSSFSRSFLKVVRTDQHHQHVVQTQSPMQPSQTMPQSRSHQQEQ